MKHFEKYKFKTVIHSPPGLGLTGPNTGRFETPQSIWGPTRDAALNTLQTASFDSQNLKSKNRLPFQFEFPNPKAKELRSQAKKLLISIFLRLDQRNRSCRVRWFDFFKISSKARVFTFEIRNGSTSRNRRLHKRNNQWILRPTSLCSHSPIKASRLRGCLFPSPWPTPSSPRQISPKRHPYWPCQGKKLPINCIIQSSFYFPIFIIIWLFFFGVFWLLGGGEYECCGDKEICGGKSKIGSGVCEFGESV